MVFGVAFWVLCIQWVLENWRYLSLLFSYLPCSFISSYKSLKFVLEIDWNRSSNSNQGIPDQYDVKVEYKGQLIRLTIERNQMEFGFLQDIIRQRFELHNAARLKIEFKDNEGERVQMKNTEEVRNALVRQRLNPLKLFVAKVSIPNVVSDENPMNDENSVGDHSAEMLPMNNMRKYIIQWCCDSWRNLSLLLFSYLPCSFSCSYKNRKFALEIDWNRSSDPKSGIPDQYDVKVEYKGQLIRRTIERNQMEFGFLQDIIRQEFELHNAARLRIEYKDDEGDRVQMKNTENVRNALVRQGLNPLQLFVAEVSNPNVVSDENPMNAENSVGDRSEEMLLMKNMGRYINGNWSPIHVDDLHTPAEGAYVYINGQ